MNRLIPILLLAAAWPAAAQQPNPVSWRVSLSPSTVSPGSAATVRVAATIDPGWHVYSVTQPSGGPMATTIALTDNPLLQRSGEIVQGKFESKDDAVFEMKVEAFSDAASFDLPVRVNAGAKPGAAEAEVRVMYQACSGRVCLMPAERVLPVRFTIASGAPSASPAADPAAANRTRAAASPAAAATPAGCEAQSIRAFYQEVASLFSSDPDHYRRRLACVPPVLGRGRLSGEDAYMAGLLWLRYDRQENTKKDFAAAAELFERYLAGPAPLFYEESGLANLVSTLAELQRFDQANERYQVLKKKYHRRSTTHEMWTDSTNLQFAGGQLIRALGEAKRYGELETLSREHVDYLKERESQLAWNLGAQAATLLRALEEQQKTEDAAAFRKELAAYFAQHPEKFPAAAEFWLTTFRVREVEDQDPAKALAILREKRDFYRKAGFERSYDQAVARLSLFDNPAPELDAALWLNSDTLSLQKLRGKVILLDFWASWCKPCREDFPELEELSKKRAADGLVVIGVTQNDGWFLTFEGKTLGREAGGKLTWDKESELVRQFVKDFQLTMPVAVGRRPENTGNPFPESPMTKHYGIQELPTTILIDRQGVVRYVGHRRGEKYENTLARLLAERTAG